LGKTVIAASFVDTEMITVAATVQSNHWLSTKPFFGCAAATKSLRKYLVDFKAFLPG
jgi:hypothetical protein